MKYILRIFTLIFVFSMAPDQGRAQTPNWLWAKKGVATNNDWGNGIATDPGGNVYVTGFFSSASITFGSVTLINTSAGLPDIFVVKYDASGNALWAKNAGGTDDDRGNNVTLDASGNVYVTGYFKSSTCFFGSTTLSNAGALDVFVTKYDAGGNVIWAVRAGGTNDDGGTDVATDAGGAVYVTGGFRSALIAFGGDTLTNGGSYDIFVTKYDSSGNALWARRAGGTGYDLSSGITTSAVGEIYVTGCFKNTAVFGSLNLTSAGIEDVFVAKYDMGGNALWAKGFGGADYDYGRGISIDGGGNVSVTGEFASTSITFGSTVLSNPGAPYSDIFVVNLDANGNVVWAKGAGGSSWDKGYGISSDAIGNVYITGFFGSSTVAFGSNILNNNNNGDTLDIFVVKYDNSGSVTWAQSAGGTLTDWANGIAIDLNGNVSLTGFFYSSACMFGNITLSNDSVATSNAFVAQLAGITGTKENGLTEAPGIYPNPFSSQTLLETRSPLKNATLLVDNCFGYTVKEIRNLNGSKIMVARENLASGLYFIRLIQDNEVLLTAKIVIAE